jgi:hypothetical protein
MKKMLLVFLATTTINTFANNTDWNIHDNSDTIIFNSLQSDFNMTPHTGIGPFIGSSSSNDATLTPLFNGNLILSNNSYITVNNDQISYYDTNANLLSKCNYNGQNCTNQEILKFNSNGNFNLTPQ